MERRYLVAALAMIATFAGLSHGFQSLQRFSLQRSQHGQTMSGPQCSGLPSIVSRVLAKVKAGLHQTDPTDPEEAQLLAEMNLPIAALQAKASEQAAKQSQAAAKLARADAVREAERAHRDALRMREEMAREKHVTSVVSIELPALAALDQTMQVRTAAMAQRLAARSVKMQIAAARLQAVSLQMENSSKRHSPCGARRAEIQ
jgi:hypothetical protein